jgi:hypothetical protein
MKSKLFLISFFITLAYFLLAAFLFESNLTESTFLMLPAIILFGAGYSGGGSAMLIVGLIAFVVCWFIAFLFTALTYKIVSTVRKQ